MRRRLENAVEATEVTAKNIKTDVVITYSDLGHFSLIARAFNVMADEKVFIFIFN